MLACGSINTPNNKNRRIYMSLSDTKIKALKPGAKPYKEYDEKGLYLLVNPNGSKLWRFKYRARATKKEKVLTLGSYPDVSLAVAREGRDEARKLIARGGDPNEERKALKAGLEAKAANSFHALVIEWHKWLEPDISPETSKKNYRLLERDVLPWLGDMHTNDIEAVHLLEVARRIEGRGTPDTAKRAIQVCGQVFKYGVLVGKAKSDPSRDISKAIKPPKVKHFASITEPKEVGELLRSFDSFNGSFTVLCALRFLPLVFVRPGELRTAKWKDIDLENSEWRFMVTKTSTEHLVPLSRQAVSILEELKPLTGKGEYVFQVGSDPKKPMSEATINAALTRLGYDTKEQITAHGFRAMARTLLHERLHYRPEVIEHQLAHVVADNLGSAYNRTKFIEVRKEMMQRWADYLDELKDGATIFKPEASPK
jgi:integrase